MKYGKDFEIMLEVAKRLDSYVCVSKEKTDKNDCVIKVNIQDSECCMVDGTCYATAPGFGKNLEEAVGDFFKELRKCKSISARKSASVEKLLDIAVVASEMKESPTMDILCDFMSLKNLYSSVCVSKECQFGGYSVFFDNCVVPDSSFATVRYGYGKNLEEAASFFYDQISNEFLEFTVKKVVVVPLRIN